MGPTAPFPGSGTRLTAVKTILNALLSLQKNKVSSVKDTVEVGDVGGSRVATGAFTRGGVGM